MGRVTLLNSDSLLKASAENYSEIMVCVVWEDIGVLFKSSAIRYIGNANMVE